MKLAGRDPMGSKRNRGPADEWESSAESEGNEWVDRPVPVNLYFRSSPFLFSGGVSPKPLLAQGNYVS